MKKKYIGPQMHIVAIGTAYGTLVDLSGGDSINDGNKDQVEVGAKGNSSFNDNDWQDDND